jgi:hypothetical protein
MCRKVLALLAFAGVLLTASANASASSLSGAWSLDVEPTHNTDPTARKFGEDVLFLEGAFSAAASAMYGFAPANYTLNNNTFTVTLTSDNHGTQVWTGSTGSTRLTGTLVWTKPDGRVLHYTFSGRPVETALEAETPQD